MRSFLIDLFSVIVYLIGFLSLPVFVFAVIAWRRKRKNDHNLKR